MPFTANLAGHGPLDATLDDLGCAMAWESVYRTRPRAALTCRACGRPMHAKMSGTGGRFFAHDRTTPDCAAAGETAEHRALKRELASAARKAGHHAALEVAADDKRWRADVLVTAVDGRRTALEAQVSSISLDDILQRTRRYGAEGIDVLWFTPRAARWLYRVPSVHLQRPQTPASPWVAREVVCRFKVEDCYCDPPWHHPVHVNWARAEDMELVEFVGELLHGRLLPLESAARGTPPGRWATPKDVQTAASYAGL